MDWKEWANCLATTITRFNSFRLLSLGYVKDKVYSEPIESLDHLKTRITDAIQLIEPDTLTKVWRNAEMRINYMIRQGGGHIEQLDI